MLHNSPIRVGHIGTAATLMHPSGMVLIDGVRVSARSSQGVIQAGDEVVVLRGDNGGLVVQLRTDVDPQTLPSFGDVVHASFGAAVQAKGRQTSESMKRWRAARENRLRRTGLMLGFGFGLMTLLAGQSVLGWQLGIVHLGGAVIGGPIFGLLYLRFLDKFLCSVDISLHRISLITAIFGLSVGLATALSAIPHLGWPGGVLFGGAMLAVASLPLPLVILFLSSEAAVEFDGAVPGEDAGGMGNIGESMTSSSE